MIDYRIIRGDKKDDYYTITVMVKDPLVIKPLIDGLYYFFDVYDMKREKAERDSKKTESEKVE